VNETTMFEVDPEQSLITPDNFAVIMLGYFIKGTGPENLMFGPNDDISKEMEYSVIVAKAMKDYLKVNGEASCADDLQMVRNFYSFGKKGYIHSLLKNGGASVEGFVGSANITVKPVTMTEVEVTIFNITSLTSGYYPKDAGDGTPYSYVRPANWAENDPTENAYSWTNQSQTFQLQINIIEWLLD
jgi:hypothetical protein